MLQKLCYIFECDRPQYAKKMCSMHYNRNFIYGDPLFPKREKRKWIIEGDIAKGTTACGKTMLIDAEDIHKVEEYDWSLNGGYPCRSGILMHRKILLPKEGKVIDHINRDRLDNRKCNLRLCTTGENACNTPGDRNASSKYKGVSLVNYGTTWQAIIRKEGNVYHLGVFNDQESAAKAYNKAAKELHGEFAYINEIESDLPPTPSDV